MSNIHLVNSHSAALSLREAQPAHDQVICIEDFPDMGPLDDGRRRAAFLNDLWRQSSSQPAPRWPQDVFAAWEKARSELSRLAPERIIIWASNSGADHVFLRMLAHFLEGLRLWHVSLQPFCGISSVAIYTPAQLQPLIGTATPISATRHIQLEREFRAIAARPEPLRLMGPEGTLVFAEMSFHDNEIANCCPPDWKPFFYAVGMALGKLSGDNPLYDFMIIARLRQLIRDGRLAVEGDIDGDLRTVRLRRLL